MATKSTSGVPRVSVESWSPNIKAPGVNKHTTYTQGKVAPLADYGAVNEAIQKSITDMAPGLATDLAANKKARNLTDEQKTFLEEQGIDEKAFLNRKDYFSSKTSEVNPSTGQLFTRKEAREEWRTRNEIPPEQKALVVQNIADNIADSTDEEYTKAAEELLVKPFNKMNGRQRKEAKRGLDKLVKTKAAMNTMMTDWSKGGIDGYDKRLYNNFPQVEAFMQHILTHDAKPGQKPYTFSNKDGGTIMYGKGQTVKMNDLIAGQGIYKNATERNNQIVKDYSEDVDGIAKQFLKQETATIKTMNEKGTNPVDSEGNPFSYDRGAEIRKFVDAQFTKEDYEDIFYNVMTKDNKLPGSEDIVFMKYTPQIHDRIVKDYIAEEISVKMGAQAPFTVADPNSPDNDPDPVTDGKVRIYGAGGYKDMDPALVAKMKKLSKVLSGLGDDPKGVVYGPDNPMPAFTESFSDIRKGDLKTSKDLSEAMETYVAQDFTRPRIMVNFDNAMNDVVKKFNSDPETLSKNEKALIKAYKSHINAFDEDLDLTGLFDPKMIQTDPPPNYDRKNKVFNFKRKNIEGNLVTESLDLTIPAEREQMFSYLVKETGDDTTDAGYILDAFLRNVKFEKTKEKPGLPTEKK